MTVQDAVSYTHLDVYKRQVSASTPICKSIFSLSSAYSGSSFFTTDPLLPFPFGSPGELELLPFWPILILKKFLLILSLLMNGEASVGPPPFLPGGGFRLDILMRSQIYFFGCFMAFQAPILHFPFCSIKFIIMERKKGPFTVSLTTAFEVLQNRKF